MVFVLVLASVSLWVRVTIVVVVVVVVEVVVVVVAAAETRVVVAVVGGVAVVLENQWPPVCQSPHLTWNLKGFQLWWLRILLAKKNNII